MLSKGTFWRHEGQPDVISCTLSDGEADWGGGKVKDLGSDRP